MHMCISSYFFVQMQYTITGDQIGRAGEVEETPLAHACACGYLEIAELLISLGADVNYLCSVCHVAYWYSKHITVCMSVGVWVGVKDVTHF